MTKSKIVVIIPAFNEEDSVAKVIRDIPRDIVDEIIVVNNNSTDQTGKIASDAGAILLNQPLQGYGNACLKGLEYIDRHQLNPDIIVFLDADYSDYPEEIAQLVEPLYNDMDMVIGSRTLGEREKGSMMPQQIFGNWLATFLIRYLYKVSYSDLGPFRAIKYDKLLSLGMCDKNYGWTVEMQIKAAKKKYRIAEIPVKYRKRIGQSKVSGTFKGTLGAGYKIISTIIKYL